MAITVTGFSQFNAIGVHGQSRSDHGAKFLVAGMFTSDLSNYAERLRLSLEKFGLDFVLYEVPTVHYSISSKGSFDLSYSKPNFINYVLNEFRIPVLYIDVDVVFRDLPKEIFTLASTGVDFGCYNWLNDRSSDAYVPASALINGISFKRRFYRFSHSVDLFDPSQLIVSGVSQFYSPNATVLLHRWLDAIACWPQVADDELLDFAYNFWDERSAIRAHWWGKSYSRYPWWIHVRPIIDHPDMPSPQGPARTFKSAAGRERFKSDGILALPSQSLFPRDCIIDTKERLLLKIKGQGEIEVVGRFTDELWVETIDEPELNIVGRMSLATPWSRTQSAEKAQTIPRNAPCPCGSGKKYKHCHGRQR